eukprot:m.47340 g.47340  ORF g.47340 m.47340 type:complete len:143 (+) comp13215_c0_seq10:91-519(+)
MEDNVLQSWHTMQARITALLGRLQEDDTPIATALLTELEESLLRAETSERIEPQVPETADPVQNLAFQKANLLLRTLSNHLVKQRCRTPPSVQAQALPADLQRETRAVTNVLTTIANDLLPLVPARLQPTLYMRWFNQFVLV